MYEEWVIFIVHGMDDFFKFFNYLFFVFFFLIFSIYELFTSTPEHHISRGEELVNIVLANSANVIERKYKIRACGSGVAMPEGPIRMLTLCFQTDFPFSKEQLRSMLVKFAEELLIQVTENAEIQDYLKNPPFTIQDVQIIIYNNQKDRREVYDPGISTAEISSGILTFRTVDPEDTFKYKNQFEETYEEALEKLKQKDINVLTFAPVV
jgi:hypothetical protein